MKSLVLALAIAASSFAQTSPYPGALDSNGTLAVAADNVQSALTAPMQASDTTAQVANATRIPQWSLITFGAEILKVCLKSGNTLTFGTPAACPSIAGRGLSGTTVVPHSAGVVGHLNIDAYHQQALATAIMAIEGSIPRMVADSTYRAAGNTLYQACAAAVSAGLQLAVSSTWTGVDTGACGAQIIWYKGGSIQPGAGKTITLSSPIVAPPVPIFDTSLGGIVKLSPGLEVYPQWFGATGNGSTDDTNAIKAALTSLNGGGLISTSELVFPSGTYKTTDTLTLSQWGMKMRGNGSYANTTISYQGPTNKVAIQVNGFLAHLSDIYVSDDGTGWSSGIDYEGSRGVFDAVYVDCRNHPGDGITAYKTGVGQSDQLSLNRPSILQCNSGYGIKEFQANSLDINLYNPSITNCWIGVATAIGTNMNVFGGEISENDVNFLPVIGSTMSINGTRSESSSRQLWTPGGSSASIAFTYTGNLVSSYTSARNASVKVTGVSGSGNITLSGNAYTFGDRIVISGAGPAGADLHTAIVSMSGPAIATVSDSLGTTVTNANVALDGTVQQYQFMGQGPGPWTYVGNLFGDVDNGTGGAGFVAMQPPGFASAAITLIGNTWAGESRTPWGLLNGANPVFGVTMINNGADASLEFGGASKMATVTGDLAGMSAAASLNYIAAETGANNAIAGTSYVPLNPGMEVTVKLGHTLRAGANTFNYNGHGADSILGKTGTNLTAARAVNDFIRVVWTGAYWQDPTDTPGAGAPTYTPPTLFSPTLSFGGASTGITYERQSGAYSEVCDGSSLNCTATYWIDIILTSKGSSTGIANITLPFAAVAGHPDAGCSVTFYDSMAASVIRQVYGRIVNTLSVLDLRQVSGTGTQVELTDADFGNTSQLALMCVFRH